MNCKKCGKDYPTNELMNGICYECFIKNQNNNDTLNDFKMSKIEEKNNFIENSVSKEFKIWAIFIIIVGIVIALLIGVYFENFILGICAFGSFYVVWMLLRAVAEIIQLLEDIKNK